MIDLPQLPVAALLQACLRSEELAWCEFVHRFQPLIAAVAAKTLRLQFLYPVPALVDDLVQNTYLKLCAENFKALREFDCRHEHALAGFLKVVTSNVVQDYLRVIQSKKRGCGKGEDDLEGAVPARSTLDRAAERIEREILLRQIELYLEKQASEPNFKRDYKIFRLYYWHGLTAQAISRRTDIRLSVKGVESALFRLTRALKTKLSPSQGKVCIASQHCHSS